MLMSAGVWCEQVMDEEHGGAVQYQASSPDEIALVRFVESVGLTLVDR